MARLRRPDALALLDAIECGTAVCTLATELAITGSDKHFEPARPPQPTSATPGSAEKIEILRQRVARGEHLWHELDRQTTPTAIRDIRQDCTSLCELVA